MGLYSACMCAWTYIETGAQRTQIEPQDLQTRLSHFAFCLPQTGFAADWLGFWPDQTPGGGILSKSLMRNFSRAAEAFYSYCCIMS